MNRNRSRYSTPESRVRDYIICPLTGQTLHVTYSFRAYIVSLYPDFAERLNEYFIQGEQDCNVILKKAIIDFAQKHPHLKTKYFVYILSMYLLSFVRCSTGYAYNVPSIYYTLARRGFWPDVTYQDAPPDFKLFLSELRDNQNHKDLTKASFFHNCFILTNRIDNYAYSLDEDTQDGEVALPTWNQLWIMRWLVFIMKQMLADGLFEFNPEQGAITVDEYTQDLIDASNEGKGRVVSRPSRIGDVNSVLPNTDKDDNAGEDY